ncbi:PRC-barrel domain-containing protein [Candidatus Peregrinibacteria bacterium]|nr:PRC-barrel domain-containing protein [Candidatus Peregrinibacteria bacterium]
MQKLYSELIGLPVFDEYSSSPLTLIRDIFIDPENGKVVAFAVKNNRIIVPLDVERLGRGLFIKDQSHIVPTEDVLRAKEVAERKIKILGSRVITQNTKIYLGRVVDYEIETRGMMLVSIHVAKTFLFFRFQEKIISYKSIIRIHKESIIVKDARIAAREKEKAAAPSSAFAA